MNIIFFILRQNLIEISQEDHEFSILLPHSFQVVGIIGLSHQAWSRNLYSVSIATKQRITNSASYKNMNVWLNSSVGQIS